MIGFIKNSFGSPGDREIILWMTAFFTERKIVPGLVISAVLHGVIYCVVMSLQSPPAVKSPMVQLEIIGREPKEAPSFLAGRTPQKAEIRTPEDGRKSRLPPAVKHFKPPTPDNSEIAVATRDRLDVETSEKMDSDVEHGPGVETETAPTQKPVIRPLTFADFEKAEGDLAEHDRQEYKEHVLETRREKGAFDLSDKRVKAALWKHRSFADPGTELPLGENKAAASLYLSTIHRKIGPRFLDFLSAFDSPFLRMHKKVQESPLKYNPFYVPPSLSERQDAARGPLSDLSLSAMTEFEIFANGNLGEVRMVRSSSSDVFDAGAVHAILQSSPFAPPPRELISRNDRAYIQWTFFRDWTRNSPAEGHVLLLSSLFDKERFNLDAGLPNANE
jgi:TonB family protein